MNNFKEAIDLATSGRLVEAIELFEQALLEDPKNPDILYNLGMCFTDTNQVNKAVKVLTKSIEYNPKYSNSYVALGYAYMKLEETERAKIYFLQALTIDPNNSYALRNLGGLYGKSGNLEESINYLEKAYKINPSDVNTVYGLGYSFQQMHDRVNADRYFRKLLEMDAPSNLKEFAKDGLREIAVESLKSKGLRMDAVMYMVSAMNLFKIESENRIRDITFEIALLGRLGLDINNPDKKYSIRTLPGLFTGLQLISYMYVGFKKISPEQDIGVDLSQEYKMSIQLFESEESK